MRFGGGRSFGPWAYVTVFLQGCGGDDPVPIRDAGADATVEDGGVDAGPATDAIDAPMPVDGDSCENPIVLRAVEGMTVSVSGNTSLVTRRPRDLGEGCGNAMAARPAPVQIVEIHVPGTGPMAVTADLTGGSTPANFDTVLQWRTMCERAPDDPWSCFDDAGEGEARSVARFTVDGGSVVYLYVTGYAETPLMGGTDRGPWTLSVSVRPNARPVVESAEVAVFGADGEVRITGSDTDGDVVGYEATFRDASARPIRLTRDGRPLLLGFDDDVEGMMRFTGTSFVEGLGEACADAGCETASLRLVDEGFALSEPIDVPVRRYELRGLGAECGSMTRCVRPLECTDGRCVRPELVERLCAGASALTIEPATATEPARASVSGTLPAGEGLLHGSCGGEGAELVYTFEIAAGERWDVAVTTDLPGTPDETDTLVYLQRECGDATSEPAGACNDDIDTRGGNYASAFELQALEAGRYHVIVDQYAATEETAAFEMRLTFRPVRESGQRCDPRGIVDRCASGRCPAMGEPVCP